MFNFGHKTTYECLSCNNDVVMDYAQAKKHILEDHGVCLNAKKELVMHIAREPRHLSIYDIKFEDGIVLRETKG